MQTLVAPVIEKLIVPNCRHCTISTKKSARTVSTQRESRWASSSLASTFDVWKLQAVNLHFRIQKALYGVCVEGVGLWLEDELDWCSIAE